MASLMKSSFYRRMSSVCMKLRRVLFLSLLKMIGEIGL